MVGRLLLSACVGSQLLERKGRLDLDSDDLEKVLNAKSSHDWEVKQVSHCIIREVLCHSGPTLKRNVVHICCRMNGKWKKLIFSVWRERKYWRSD